MKSAFAVGMLLLTLCGCYQVRSDDLSTVPVTNNPSVVPQHGNLSQFTAMHPQLCCFYVNFIPKHNSIVWIEFQDENCFEIFYGIICAGDVCSQGNDYIGFICNNFVSVVLY